MLESRNLLAIIIVFAIAASLLTAISYLYLEKKTRLSGAEEVQNVRMELVIGDRVGLNTDTDMLDFGIVMPGSGVTRAINITNARPYDVTVRLFNEGNISPFVSFPEETMVKSNESLSMPVSADAPLDAAHEGYSGELTIAYFRS